MHRGRMDGRGQPDHPKGIPRHNPRNAGSTLERASVRLAPMPFSSTASLDIRAPLSGVWDAITKPEIVKQYFFGTNLVTDWKVGSPLFFRGEWQGKTYEDRGTVLSFDPMKSLSYNYWSSFSGIEDSPALRQIIQFDLDSIVDGVRITIRQSNVDTQARADHSATNWRSVLEALKLLLEGKPAA